MANFTSMIPRLWKRFFPAIIITSLIAIAFAAFYGYEHGLTQKWQKLIQAELAKQGMRAELGRLTIDPFNGLTARDVQLYSMAHRNRKLADFTSLHLEVDLHGLLNRKDFIKSIRLVNADLQLPVDPDADAPQMIRLSGINARLLVSKERITIVQAEGNIAGLLVRASGDLDLPPPRKKSAEEEEAEKQARRRQWEEMKERRGALNQLVSFLNELRSTGGKKPVLELQLNGPLRDFRRMDIRLDLEASQFTYRDFTGEALRITGSMRDSVIRLKNLELRDPTGSFRAEAVWNPWEERSIPFAINSGIDLQKFTKTFFDLPILKEMVFYKSPSIRVDGRYYIDQPWSSATWPVDLVGSIGVDGKITTKGVIFDGFKADVGIKQGDFFIRNVSLKHREGEARGRFLRTRDGGVRYELDWGITLQKLLPFLPDMGAQQWFNDFNFTENSYVSIKAVGSGTELDPLSWNGSANIDLAEFSHREVHFKKVSASVSVAEGKYICRNVLVERPEGKITAEQVNILPAEHKLDIQGVKCNVYPAPIMRCIGRHLEAAMVHYVFSSPPEATFRGTFYTNNGLRNTLHVEANIKTPLTLNFNDKSYVVNNAVAKVSQKEHILSVEATGLTAPGLAHPPAFLPQSTSVQFQGAFRVSRQVAPVNRWKLELPKIAEAQVTLANTAIPMTKLQATVAMDAGRLEIASLGTLAQGSANVELLWEDISRRPNFTGEVLVSQAGFGILSRLFDPASKAQGRVTSSFNFNSAGDVKTLSGSGELLLEENDVFTVPLLGPLSGLLSAIFPLEKLAYSTAREATANFTMKNGVVETQNFKARTPAFELTVGGIVNLAQDRIGLTARINLRGIPGFLFFPVSKLLEYEAQGTLKTPEWRPKHLPTLR